MERLQGVLFGLETCQSPFRSLHVLVPLVRLPHQTRFSCASNSLLTDCLTQRPCLLRRQSEPERHFGEDRLWQGSHSVRYALEHCCGKHHCLVCGKLELFSIRVLRDTLTDVSFAATQGYLPGFYIGVFLPDLIGRVNQQFWCSVIVAVLYAIWAGVLHHANTGGLVTIFTLAQLFLNMGKTSSQLLFPLPEPIHKSNTR